MPVIRPSAGLSTMAKKLFMPGGAGNNKEWMSKSKSSCALRTPNAGSSRTRSLSILLRRPTLAYLSDERASKHCKSL